MTASGLPPLYSFSIASFRRANQSGVESLPKSLPSPLTIPINIGAKAKYLELCSPPTPYNAIPTTTPITAITRAT
ncbi:hypothetical protein ES705_30428 [subsurface metagenome]